MILAYVCQLTGVRYADLRAERGVGSPCAMNPLIAVVFAILTAVALATEAEAASYRTELWTTFFTTGPASYCQVYAQGVASALMVQRRICLSTTVSSLALADVALRYKRPP